MVPTHPSGTRSILINAPIGDERERPTVFTGTHRYRPLELLGRGAMGVVYRVHDLETGTDVALKTLAVRDPEQLFILKQEFRALAGIQHNNLVDLYELTVNERDCFFTMEPVDGRSFIEHVRDGWTPATDDPPPPLDRFVGAGRQLVGALMAVHAAGKLHRDVKPSNVMVARDGRVVLLDFGLATVVGAGYGDVGIVGTFAYMAPEVAWGAAPHQSADWYSVGILFYEALTGQLPFDGPLVSVLEAKRRRAFRDPSTLAPHVPRELDALIRTMLDPEPEHRPDGSDVLAALGPTARPARTARRWSGFVGRAQEFSRLRDAYEETCRGRLAITHVRGPSGIGKTELVRRFALSVEREGALLLAGKCNLHELVPYKALDGIVDSLSRFLSSLPEAESAGLAPDDLQPLLRLFPVLGRIPAWRAAPGASTESDLHELRRRGFAALRELLGRLSVTRPVLIWIDDAQWSDADSVALLRDVLNASPAPALLLVVSYRSEEQLDGPLLTRPASERGAMPLGTPDVVDVGPLPDPETAELARLLCAAQLDEDWRLAEIVKDAAGNPFFIGELARSLREDDAPDSVRLSEVVARRARRLGDAARRVLEIVCVAGRPLERALVLEASQLGRHGRAVITGLEKQSLVRMTTSKERLAVEVYHDRIRETLLGELAVDSLRSRHGDLADAMAREAEPDPASLLLHLREADRRAEAAGWAVRAADRASDALAFEDAAELYDEAIRLGDWRGAVADQLRVQRADALVNCGRCAAAAPLYREVARTAPTAESRDLRRRAAAQYLISGHIDEGVGELRSLLSDLGLRYPASPWSALAGIAGRALQLSLRRLSVRTADGNLPPATLTRIDMCHFAAKGLVAVDPARAVYFALRSVLLSMRAGDRHRAGRDFATCGSMLAAAGWPVARFGERMIAIGRAIGEETDDPYLLGNAMLAASTTQLVRGRWNEMLETCDDAANLLRDRCRGMTPELNLARMVSIRALEELGDIPQVRTRAHSLEREAERVGDLYALITARLYTALWRIADGDPAGALAQSRAALAPWSQGTYSLQHFYALRIEACCDLYEGRPEAAFAKLAGAWPALRRSNVLRDPVAGADGHALRGRLAIAMSERTGDRRFLSRAERAARKLARVRRPDTIGGALLIRGGIAAVQGNPAAARVQLEESVGVYRDAGMMLHVAYARRRLAQLEPGARRSQLTADADRVLRKFGIADPSAWLEVQAPGFAAHTL